MIKKILLEAICVEMLGNIVCKLRFSLNDDWFMIFFHENQHIFIGIRFSTHGIYAVNGRGT